MSIDAIILERKQDFTNVEKSFESVGLNTGNQLFRESLLKNINLAKMTYQEYEQMEHVFKGIPIVTTDLIWINENSDFEWLYNRVKKHKDTSFVPMSVGLQSRSFEPNFKLNNTVVNTLSAIQERAIIGVRGYYTAEILNKHGIKNIEVIGCPSLYYAGNPKFQIEKKGKVEKVTTNFRTFYGTLSQKEKHYLTYCANRGYDFVEQTKYEFVPENANDINFYNYISGWLKNNKKLFFSAEEWKNYTSKFDFSMGLRFHGNVVALWNQIPALLFAIDSRTEELASFFDIPFIKLEEFDFEKPIEYYYELADFSKFNRNYEERYNRYCEFMKKNNLIR